VVEIILALLMAVLPACPTEDASGINCKWDASEQGNGEGRDLIVLGEDFITIGASDGTMAERTQVYTGGRAYTIGE
jgi:arginine deiminase